MKQPDMNVVSSSGVPQEALSEGVTGQKLVMAGDR